MNILENIPKSWKEITLRQWRDICQVKAEDDLDRTIQTLSIILECSEEQIRDLELNDFKELCSEIKFVGQRINEPLEPTFKLRGKEYGIIPKADARFISAGEFLDIETWKANPTENIHLIAALVYRPVIGRAGDEYRIEKYSREGFMQRANLFLEELPITYCYNAVLFFSAYVMKSTEIMLDYLQEEMMTPPNNQKKKTTKKKTRKPMKKSKQKPSTESGAGMQ